MNISWIEKMVFKTKRKQNACGILKKRVPIIAQRHSILGDCIFRKTVARGLGILSHIFLFLLYLFQYKSLGLYQYHDEINGHRGAGSGHPFYESFVGLGES